MNQNTTITTHTMIGILGMAIGLAATPAAGQVTYEWLGLGDGVSFSDTLNWTLIGLPTALDEAKFDTASSWSINFTTNPINATASIENDTIQFNLGAQTYTLAELIVGDRLTDVGTLTLNGGNLVTTTGLARVGRLSPATGSLIMTGGATMTNQRDLIIGDAGIGFFQLDAGCTVSSLITFIADETTSTGNAIIHGTWNIQNSALIGNSGIGSLTVEAGGDVTVGLETKVGDDLFSSGSLTIDGAGSTLTSSGATTIGNFGTGSLTVSNGGLLTTTQLKIADDAPATVTIDAAMIVDTIRTDIGNRAAGSLVLMNGGVIQSPLVSVTSLFGTLTGSGTVTGTVLNAGQVNPGTGAGALNVTGNFTQTLGTLNIELGGPVAETQYDQLQVSGISTLGGTLNVSLINGFNPANGQFIILQGGIVNGTFLTANLPAGFSIAYEADRVVLNIGTPCVADINGDGVLDLADINGFISAFLANDPAADLAPPAGIFDLTDLSTFVQSFVAGCP